MTLSEVYFFMILTIYLGLCLAIVVFTEDLKDSNRLRKYLKLSLIIAPLGIVMELLQWNYLCNIQCILVTFSPFLTLVIVKGVLEFYRKVFKKEPYQMHNGRLSDGFYAENLGNIKFKRYYSIYTVSVLGLPIMIFTILSIIIKETIC